MYATKGSVQLKRTSEKGQQSRIQYAAPWGAYEVINYFFVDKFIHQEIYDQRLLSTKLIRRPAIGMDVGKAVHSVAGSKV